MVALGDDTLTGGSGSDTLLIGSDGDHVNWWHGFIAGVLTMTSG